MPAVLFRGDPGRLGAGDLSRRPRRRVARPGGHRHEPGRAGRVDLGGPRHASGRHATGDLSRRPGRGPGRGARTGTWTVPASGTARSAWPPAGSGERSASPTPCGPASRTIPTPWPTWAASKPRSTPCGRRCAVAAQEIDERPDDAQRAHLRALLVRAVVERGCRAVLDAAADGARPSPARVRRGPQPTGQRPAGVPAPTPRPPRPRGARPSHPTEGSSDMLTVDDANLGTPERQWLDAGRARTTSPRCGGCSPTASSSSLPIPTTRSSASAAACGSLARPASEIEIVAVTDGEASHPGSVAMTPASSWPGPEPGRPRSAAAPARAGPMPCHPPRIPGRRGRRPPGGADERAHRPPRRGHPLPGDVAPRRPSRPRRRRHGGPGPRTATGARLVEYPVWAWHWATPDGGAPAMPWAACPPARARRRRASGRRPRRSRRSSPRSPRSAPTRPTGWCCPAPVLERFHRSFEVLFEIPPARIRRIGRLAGSGR